MYRILICLFGLVVFKPSSQAGQVVPHSWDEACAAAEAHVAEGDLIFLDIPNVLFRQVAEATRSWTSHVGIAFKNSDGEWVVAESAVPRSREQLLCNYLKRSSEHKFEIKRLNRPLNPLELEILKFTSKSHLDKYYDLGFDFESKRMYCSKFVYTAYRSIGIEVGEVQTFKELLAQNPTGPVGFWKAWFFGRVPWNRKTVTPASQLNDSDFITVIRGQ